MAIRGWNGAWLLALAVLAGPASAVTLGQKDTFQDGTTDSWISGGPNPNPPLNIANGGPAGAGDRYLLVTANGAGQGGKLVIFNLAQWTGNYLTAGVGTIGMDVDNFGATELDLRLEFIGGAGSAYSTNPVIVPVGTGWQHVTFLVTPSALTGSAATALGATTELRLYHGDAAALNVVAQLGIDNVTAAAVPEPSPALSLTAGLAALFVIARRRRRPG